MHPPHPPSPPNPPGLIAAAVTQALARHGLTGIYTAAAEKVAVISVTAGLTMWTDGRQLWCIHGDERHTWPAAEIELAAARLAALAGPAVGR